MARIVGIELADNLRIDYALTKIKGIGWALSRKILAVTKIDPIKRMAKLTNEEIGKITARLEEYQTEGELLRAVKANIARLKNINSYRGLRHSRNLPVRGQRTRTNARTKRGKRKTIGAFKKEALSKMKGPEEGEKSAAK